MSKGSKQRPTDQAAYDAGYELAFGKKENSRTTKLDDLPEWDLSENTTTTTVHTLQ